MKLIVTLIITLSIMGYMNVNNEIDLSSNNYNNEVANSMEINMENTIVENADKIVLQWEFEEFLIKYESSDSGYTGTKVFLRVIGDDNHRLEVGEYLGQPYILNEFDDFPEETVMGCSFWFAGAGDDVIVTRSTKNELVVYRRELDEGSEEVEGYTSELMEMKRIEISEDAEIEFREAESKTID